MFLSLNCQNGGRQPETATKHLKCLGKKENYKQLQHNLTHRATKTHQKEHLGLFLPRRTENRPLSNLSTRRNLCCQSRNPQIILVHNGLF